MIRIVFLGYGNAGSHLCAALDAQESMTVIQVYSRQENTLKKVPNHINTTTDSATIVAADIYIISIPDDAIASFSETLNLEKSLLVHTSGSVPLTAISAKYRRGVFYPLQTFSAAVKPDFTTIPFCIEAESKKDEDLLITMASSISNNVQLISSKQRETIHIAAVVANNFVNQLYTISSEILEEQNIDFEILKPLIIETAQKITRLSPKNAQTGPAKRGDQLIIEKHILALENDTYRDIYRSLTEAIIKTHTTTEN